MASKLSYKFQRLREQLRQAIGSGEFTGKLPGERQLAKRFGVNAKTLSKALTDLAAEGLLDRNIGRGTFVKTDAEGAGPRGEKWIFLCEPDYANSTVIPQLQQIHPDCQIVTDASELRPSLLNGVSAVIDFCAETPDAVLRDLVVRNIPVVLVGREPKTYSVNAVLVDRQLGASLLARDMMMRGHRRFLAVERKGETVICEALRRTADHVCPEAIIDCVFTHEVLPALASSGATAVVCESRTSAAAVADALRNYNGSSTPISLGAVGSGSGNYPCSGYFVRADQKAQTIADLVKNAGAKRPITLWLTGTFVDQQSIHTIDSAHPSKHAHPQALTA